MKYDKELFNNVLTKYNIAPTGNIRVDFESILAHYDIESIFNDLYVFGILAKILPEFLPCIDLDQKTLHHCYTVDKHIFKTVKNIALTPNLSKDNKHLLLWAALLHDIGKPNALRHNLKKGRHHFTNHASFSAKMSCKILSRFGFGLKEILHIKKLVQHHEFFRYIKLYNMGDKGNRMSTGYVIKTIKKVGIDNFKLLIILHRADLMAQSEHFRESKLLINKRAQNILDYYISTNNK